MILVRQDSGQGGDHGFAAADAEEGILRDSGPWPWQGRLIEVFDKPMWVDYGQAYVLSGDSDVPDLEVAFRGQVNGLCGTAVSGAMFLLTGLHTGQVGFTVEVSGSLPELDLSWEEIVEAPFLVPDLPIALYQWGEASGEPLALPPGQYRARYSARNMQAGHDKDTLVDDAAIIDEYLLQLWQAPAEADQVIKQTSEIAAYWHDFASGLPKTNTLQPGERVARSRLDKRTAGRIGSTQAGSHGNEQPRADRTCVDNAQRPAEVTDRRISAAPGSRRNLRRQPPTAGLTSSTGRSSAGARRTRASGRRARTLRSSCRSIVGCGSVIVSDPTAGP
jgi:hypothetical protein